MTHNIGTHLPAGWCVARISEIAEANPRLDVPDHADTSTVSFVPMTAVEAETGAMDLSRTKHLSQVRKGYRYFRAGDVLFAKITPCMENGKMAVVPPLEYGVGFGSTEFHVLRPRQNISSDYLYRFVSTAQFRREAERHMTGAVGQRRVPTSYLGEQSIPLPPSKEQYRIVTKIDELFSELETGTDSIKKARAQLATYRQAALKHAIEGRVTTQWREANKDKLEAPGQLFDRINRARTERYENQFINWRMAVDEWKRSPRLYKMPPRPAPPRALSPLLRAETERLPTLPAGWLYVRLGLLIDEPKYGTSKKCDYNFSGTGVLRIPNVVDGVINTADLKGARFDSADMQAYSLVQGDVLMIRSNGSISIVGKSAIVSEAEEEYIYAGYLMRLRSNHNVVISEYLLLVLESQFIRVQIEEKAKSTSGVNNINAREVQSLVVPLCSVNEQRLIVKQLANVLSAIDTLDREITDQLSVAYALRQAILARAFSGQLIPQDPSDVPASILLERISADRGRAAKLRTRRSAGERRAARA